MHRLIALIFATVFGSVGWWLGDYVGIMTALIVSVVASAVGWYVGIVFAQRNI